MEDIQKSSDNFSYFSYAICMQLAVGSLHAQLFLCISTFLLSGVPKFYYFLDFQETMSDRT